MAPRVAVSAERSDVTKTKTELLVVDAYEGVEKFAGVTAAVDKMTGGALTRVLDAGDFKGGFKEMALVHPSKGPAKRVLLVGMGPIEKLSVDRVRRVSAVVARRARELKVERYHSVLLGVAKSDGARLDARIAAEAMAEGALLGLYTFEMYRGVGTETKPVKLKSLVLADKDAARIAAAKEGARVGAAIAEATNQCRDWAAFSGADAAPEAYGARVEALAAEHGLLAEVHDKARLEREGFGGILAVAQGSARAPVLARLEHAPKDARGTIVLVGKGITFDSGGISIKGADGMQDMKMDKSGAAAVMSVVVAAKRLKLPLRVIGLAPFSDNMPSGSAYKPGDIVTTKSGKTIEIINTDAEGRVVLSDALHHAASFAPDAVIDVATLTGGCIIAVGHHAIAGMGNSDALLAQLRKAGDATNERVWPVPFFDEYGEMVKSKVADVRNSAGRIASAMTAGKFLEHFAPDAPWVHLDIASTAWHEGASPRLNEEYCPEHATGVGTRLLVEWLRHWEKVEHVPKKTDKKPTSRDRRAHEPAPPKRRISSS